MTIPENPRTPSLKDLLEEILATFQTKIRPLWSPKDPNRFRETMKALSAIKLRSSEIEQSLPGKNLASSVGVMLIFCRKKTGNRRSINESLRRRTRKTHRGT